MARLLADYIQLYEQTLAPEACQAMIERFEASPGLQEQMHAEHSYRFTEITVSRHCPRSRRRFFAS